MGRIWLGQKLNDQQLARLKQSVQPYEIVHASAQIESVLHTTPRDPVISNCEIAFGQPEVRDVIETKSLAWIALTTAGYTRYDNDEVRRALAARGAQLTNASAVYSEPTSQHLLAMMLAMSRQFPLAIADQLGAKSWNQEAVRSRSRLLDSNSTVFIVGFGSIGARLAELLAPFNIRLIGFRRKVRGDESIETFPIDKLDKHLSLADHIVNILPASPSTIGFFDRARFARFKSGSIFYNAGRGDTVDQDALFDALDINLGQACLDVTTPEPLPSSHRLWTHPRCFVTPHTAGGLSNEIDRHIDQFIENVSRFRCREPLIDRVM
ncbi:MAG TPA: D-2-hydroxyacid dehydrogenase [Tepidisphaeraceae bacterium]|nr:D-2-hydroxyacid dehydrogenase [Tepidisphaeraceae bacterium]